MKQAPGPLELTHFRYLGDEEGSFFCFVWVGIKGGTIPSLFGFLSSRICKGAILKKTWTCFLSSLAIPDLVLDEHSARKKLGWSSSDFRLVDNRFDLAEWVKVALSSHNYMSNLGAAWLSWGYRTAAVCLVPVCGSWVEQKASSILIVYEKLILRGQRKQNRWEWYFGYGLAVGRIAWAVMSCMDKVRTRRGFQRVRISRWRGWESGYLYEPGGSNGFEGLLDKRTFVKADRSLLEEVDGNYNAVILGSKWETWDGMPGHRSQWLSGSDWTRIVARSARSWRNTYQSSVKRYW